MSLPFGDLINLLKSKIVAGHPRDTSWRYPTKQVSKDELHESGLAIMRRMKHEKPRRKNDTKTPERPKNI